MDVGHDWHDKAGGSGWSVRHQHDLSSDPGADQSNDCLGVVGYPPSEWPVLLAGAWNVNPECSAFRDQDNPPVIGMEHCDVDDPTSIHWGPTPILDIYSPWYGELVTGTLEGTYKRTAQTTVKLFTGGKKIVHRSNLFVAYASVAEVLDKRAVPPLTETVHARAISPTEITVSDMGALGSDGRRYKVLPDGETKDLTPKTSRKFYVFTVDASKHKLKVSANGTDLETEEPRFCVGQKVVLAYQFLPALPEQPKTTNITWSLAAPYVNAKEAPRDASDTDYYMTTCHPKRTFRTRLRYPGEIGEPPCTYYSIYDPLLKENETGAWWTTAGRKFGYLNLETTFPNGQTVSLSRMGLFSMHKPTFSNFNPHPEVLGFTWSGGVEGVLSASMLWEVEVQSDFDGDLGITQLINGIYIQDGWRVTKSTAGHLWLDGNTELYEQIPYRVSDPVSHVIGLDDNPAEIAFIYSVHMTADFKDYLRFMPSGDDNIWVTLGTNGWNIEGYATLPGGLLINSNPPASAPVESDQFPEWQYHWPE
jgi:hypothetical protein